MVVRFTVFMGVLLGVVSWLLLVPFAPADFQASSRSAIDDARKAGLVPMPGELKMSTTVGHDVFEVPDADAERLAEIIVAEGGTAGMEGMAMGETEGEQAEQPMPGMQMGEKEAEQPMEGMQMGGTEGEQAEMPMQGMAMESEGEHGEETEAGHGGGGGLTIMGADMAGMAGRTIEIDMAEWEFSNKSITVKPGEIIRLVVRNKGNMPHEFMFMQGPAMQAVNYRLERADWNLLEHEAPYEQAIVLPGDSFEVVMRIEQPGMWMYMCMFPYHMQFGMMGMMMTEGASMDMGGMKM
jgi:uncharacterized cupredoxin-like copper-binding protein